VPARLWLPQKIWPGCQIFCQLPDPLGRREANFFGGTFSGPFPVAPYAPVGRRKDRRTAVSIGAPLEGSERRRIRRRAAVSFGASPYPSERHRILRIRAVRIGGPP
jgi:hypothetical protein